MKQKLEKLYNELKQENKKLKLNFEEAKERIDSHLRNIQNLELHNIKLKEEGAFWKAKNDEKIEVIQRLETQVDKLINYFIQ